jgi:hypothetical protein
VTWRWKRARCRWAFTTQCTCFTSTKVQTLTQVEEGWVQEESAGAGAAGAREEEEVVVVGAAAAARVGADAADGLAVEGLLRLN